MLKIKNINKLIGTKLCNRWEIVNVKANYSEYIFEVETGGIVMYNPHTFTPVKHGAKRQTINLNKSRIANSEQFFKLESSIIGGISWEITKDQIKSMDTFIDELEKFVEFCENQYTTFKTT